MSDVESAGPGVGHPGGMVQPTAEPAREPSTEVALRPTALVPVNVLTPADERYHEKWAAFWFILAALGGIGFFAWMWWGPAPVSNLFTPVLGAFLAMAITPIGVGVIYWGKTLMGHESAVQLREPLQPTEQERQTAATLLNEGLVRTGIARFSLLRRTLLGGSALAITLPLLSVLRYLNPQRPRSGQLTATGITPGVRLVDDTNTPVKLGDIEVGGVMTVFPENDTGTSLGPTLLIRLGPGVNRPLPGRAGWEVQGHVAYSKICTHLGCPVGLYEQQRHVLLCPCHQSQFNVQSGCKVMFGPAARPLPQLDIYLDDQGFFHARADYDQPVGPSFWERK